jgi:predicted enzyme related to lactoylglutathione lyase
MEAQDWARPVVHWEIVALDAARQADFYRELFNWQVGEGPIRQIDPGLGGPEPGPAGHIRQGDRAQVTLYVQVRDLPASLERAKRLGGRVLMEPMDLPNGPTIAAIADPEGNPVGLVQQ